MSAVLTDLSISIVAYKHRIATVVDIGGAYLNANMDTGILVLVRLDQTISVSSLLVKLDQSYSRHVDNRIYVDNRECIVMLLKKALHGCVESAALWHRYISRSIVSLG